MSDVRILTISGSLRRDSHNTRLLREAERLDPGGVMFDHFSGLGKLPLFNEDEEHPAPPAVVDLRDRVRRADAVLIATPEYNSGIPGGLKNALDWLSRGEMPLAHKPTAIIGASPGAFGTVRAQTSLRRVLHKMNVNVLRHPEFLLGHAHTHFDANGCLPADSPTVQLLTTVLDGLVDLVEEHRAKLAAA
ncbi:NADPH-dependent FMN reductase [Kutzneria sp. NPDC051319]|uniref:NADPH-dependent FMN reductase n=1 Tax=Kutzneria sp. NPDC051319 TaxID=3155047 RepID=UPI0034351F1C